MLADLVRYAHGKSLDVEAGFRAKDVKWLVLFRPEGTFVDIAPLGTEKRGLKIQKCPHLQFSGDTPMRQFLVDTAEYMVLLGVDAADTKTRRKHAYALDLLAQAGTAVPELAIIAMSLGKPETLAAITKVLGRLNAKAADNVTPALAESSGTRIFLQEQSWHGWWRNFYPTLLKEPAPSGSICMSRCLVSGEPCNPSLTHPKVRGLGDVGGRVETALVSFDPPAFRSYGLMQSANAPVSARAANSYVGALNHLIETTGQRLAGVKVIHWYAGQDERPIDLPREQDPQRLVESVQEEVPGLFEAPTSGQSPRSRKSKTKVDPEADRHATEGDAQRRARAFLRSVRLGERPDLASYRYYSATLSGSSARVMVRDFATGKFSDLCAAVDEWFNDLDIMHRDPNVGGLAPPPKFGAVLGTMVRELKDVAPPVAAKLWRTAVHHEPIPEPFAAQALNRAVINIIKGETANHARMGLLRAYLRRKGDQHVTPFLNEDHPAPAYQCGRLLAVLDDIQYAALGDVGAGIIQRYYAAASATPALVLGRLVRLANTGHLPKIEGGLRRWHEQRLALVWATLRTDPPITLSLTDQTLFAMGYYQQKAQPRTKSESDE